MDKFPKVSVATITYGHQDYIIETIKGVFAQKYDGLIEFIIANDCSPDNTDKVIKDYLASHPAPKNIEIKYTCHKKNIGVLPNSLYALEQASGKYIAPCEGDDFWTDPYKISKQVQYLEENQDCNLVYHRSNVLYEESGKLELEALDNPNFTMKRDLEYLSLNGNFMCALTVMYRNNFEVPKDLFKNGIIGDYILWFLNGEKGSYGYIPDVMSVYRLREGSVFGKKKQYFQAMQILIMLNKLKNYTKDKKIKNNLKKQLESKMNNQLALKGLSIKEKIIFILFILKIQPSYIFTLLKRVTKYILKKTND
ncbi:glycosyltransferase family 2 protein [Elizabethkingia anophelis]|nr:MULTISPECIES: glycosyltransferase family A protein [Elizabethkingia]KUF46365.1 glycosyl transferase family 2 [Elizabethkingia anophelis]MCT3643451.1 glycosyltransferase family 2 protein [Elizabethkingia anophelis]MCT3650297.1 glycosyltransferase family 2 protein [Elizabethkingia anophelis]MCT3653914.1 glycosyltransferase family 2 protein [Elizabethkingia anophelis]MCT3657705.1 glycosyltransferase family 2 protein [Elizabethkingia anophelis]